MRDNFSKKTKELLAKRVAFRCSFPGCHRITIGPSKEDNESVINLGEAAHINAASQNGPRYDESMTPEERRSISNGIWMCRHHARMIDADFINYSESTLRQWKELAEKRTYELLEEFGKEEVKLPTTLIAIGGQIVVEGIWLKIEREKWSFEVIKFVLGDYDKLFDFTTSDHLKNNRYIVVETQGDGRLLTQNPILIQNKDKINLEVAVEEKSKRTVPYRLSDIATPLKFENGDFKLVKGEECAKQFIERTLSTQHGGLLFAGDFGSYFSKYYWRFKEDIYYLNRMLNLELTRLISIPYIDSTMKSDVPPLDFINRIHEVEIIDTEIRESMIQVKVELEWGDGKHWADTIKIYINEKEKNTAHNKV